MEPLAFEKVDEVADGLDPLDHIIGNFHPEPIFDGEHQFDDQASPTRDLYAEVLHARHIWRLRQYTPK